MLPSCVCLLAMIPVGSLVLMQAGCPIAGGDGVWGGTGTTTLTVSTYVAPGTVDKLVSLVGTVSGGTEPYTYSWVQLSGPSVTLTGADQATATFTPTVAGIYQFTLAAADSRSTPRRGSATASTAVGDIEFVVRSTTSAIIPGNPATVLSSSRVTAAEIEARARVFDPEFTEDQQTQMQVQYTLVSVPTGAREEDVSLDREFDTISNQGQGDVNYGPPATLDGAVTLKVRANPEASFNVLTNLATLVANTGIVVPGDYVFRATVTNPNGVQRTRDLTVTLLVQGVSGVSGAGGSYLALSAGPTTVQVKQLPAGSPGNVTDKVMLGDDTATMVVTVLPSSETDYRFYLLDNNQVAHSEYVTWSPTGAIAATGAPTDIALTISSGSGLPTGTYSLMMESFDALGTQSNVAVSVNRPLIGAGAPVRFHVTQDFYAQSAINSANVGAASNAVDAPVAYQGWSGANAAYGAISALADVDRDGAPDIITASGAAVDVREAGFVDGSTAALRQPNNSGNFGPTVGAPVDASVALGGAAGQMAVGDLNGDGLPDVTVVTNLGGFGTSVVQIYFHTGNPALPYSDAADQTLQIVAPEYDRLALNTDAASGTLSASMFGDPVRNLFGTQLGVFDATGDGQADLVVTDPGFNQVHVLNVALPTAPATVPPAANTYYEGNEGRVYVFAGGSSGVLRPGRPAIITSLITEREITNGAAPVFPTAPALTTSWSEANVQYAAAYIGGEMDQLGYSLAGAGNFAVGSPLAAGNGSLQGAVTIVNPVSDGDTITVAVTQPGGGPAVTRVYEFDNNSATAAGNVAVTLGAGAGDNSAEDARAALIAAINGDAAAQVFVTAAANGAVPQVVDLMYLYDAVDGAARVVTVFMTITNGVLSAGNGPVAPTPFVQNADGIVYRVAAGAASGSLTGGIAGTTDSNMGFGAVLALGMVTQTTAASDLVVSALDSGAAAGVNNGLPFDLGDDGAVFLLAGGSATLPAALTVGANTLGTGGTGGTDLTPTAVGATLGLGDVNGDGLSEIFMTEPGFDRIYMIKGAATPSTSPNLTVSGVAFNTSLGLTGTFLIGDITGDTEVDWLFLSPTINVGFTGFER